MRVLEVSERFACRRSHPRQGFRRAYHDARGEGWTVDHKKIQRLWRE
jgi:hypothetical protein